MIIKSTLWRWRSFEYHIANILSTIMKNVDAKIESWVFFEPFTTNDNFLLEKCFLNLAPSFVSKTYQSNGP